MLEDNEIVTIKRGAYDFGKHTEKSKRINKGLNLITRSVCKRCNHGWVKRLGEWVEPYVAPMILGHQQTIHPTVANAAVRWAGKIAIGIDSGFPPEDRRIHADFSRDFYRGLHRCHLAVWAGRYIGKMLISHSGYRLHPTVRPGMDTSAPPGFCFSITVGELMFQVVGVSEVDDLSLALKHAEHRPAFQLWPPSAERVVWPPWEIYTDETIAGFCRRQVWGGEGPKTRLILPDS